MEVAGAGLHIHDQALCASDAALLLRARTTLTVTMAPQTSIRPQMPVPPNRALFQTTACLVKGKLITFDALMSPRSDALQATGMALLAIAVGIDVLELLVALDLAGGL